MMRMSIVVSRGLFIVSMLMKHQGKQKVQATKAQRNIGVRCVVLWGGIGHAGGLNEDI
jgi:hypothetical protein